MPQFEVYRDDANEYRWSLEADDGEMWATSGEGYSSKDECLDGMQVFMNGAGYYEDYVGEDGDQCWRFRANNGPVVATSAGGYLLKLHAQQAYERVRAEASDADIVEE